jgi:hypothetical protein
VSITVQQTTESRRTPADVIIDVIVAVLLCCEVIAVSMALSGLEGNVQTVAFVASGFFGFSSFLWGGLALARWFITPQMNAEWELRSALERMEAYHRDTTF